MMFSCAFSSEPIKKCNAAIADVGATARIKGAVRLSP